MEKMLEYLHIEDFKSLKSVKWYPGALNVVIGPNASGKSNLLSALEMISAAARGKLGDYVQLQAGIGALLWNGEGRAVGVAVRFRNDNILRDVRELLPRSDISGPISYRFELTRLGQSPNYTVEKEDWRLFGMTSGKVSEALVEYLLTRGLQELKIDGKDSDELHLDTRNLSREEVALSLPLPVDDHTRPLILTKEYLASWGIFQNFRSDPESPIRQPLIARYSTQVSVDGDNLASVLHTLYERDKEFAQEIDVGMNAAFGEAYESLTFPPVADQRVQLSIRWKGLQGAHASHIISDGTLRFLYLLAILAQPDPPALIAIDEPETGLHPRMLPIIAEYAEEASNRTQVVITTHSPEFLSAFRETTPTTTVAELVDGQTQLHVLAGEDLAHWLKEYSLGELFTSGTLEALG
ncbi:MAG: AAA family ATPase [Candidatus Hydrogenedentes bacterium]|nr:AAA family ATPase [Candidatus Hydrogenedentota bacterium]